MGATLIIKEQVGRDLVVQPHIEGLEACRFIAAIWVFLFHGGAPYSSYTSVGFNIHYLPLQWMLGIYHSLFNGVAAVILFFIISGICIHYPYYKGKNFVLSEFYVRRLTRVVIPLTAIYLLALILQGLWPLSWGGHGKPFNSINSVAWSLYCEIAYYLGYPMIRLLMKQIGVKWITFLAFVATAVTAVFYRDYESLAVYPFFVMIISGLSFWLLGIMWLEQMEYRRLRAKSFLIILIFWQTISGILRFHLNTLSGGYVSDLSFGLSQLLFGPLCFYSLARMLKMVQRRTRLFHLISRFGVASYSIYLVHPIVLSFAYSLSDNPDFIPKWFAMAGALAVAVVIFHFLIEKPSHRLARKLGQWCLSKAGLHDQTAAA